VATDPTEDAFRASLLFQELERRAAAEDWAGFESEAKRQHFIPRFVLSRFARCDGKREFFFQLDVNSGKASRIAPGQAASRRHFYAIVDEEGQRSNRVEGFLALVESHAAVALDPLLDNPAGLAPADRATLSFFFALLDGRTPGSADRMAVSSSSIMRMLFTTEFADTETFAATYRKLFGDASDDTIEDFRQGLLCDLKEGRVDFADPRAHAFGLNFGAAGAAAPIIYDMHWTLLRRPAAFITSDRGVAMYDPKPRFPWSGQAWVSSPNVQVTIPLSSDCCLLLDHREQATEVVDVDEQTAGAINLRTYGWAGDYIYGQSQELVAHVRRLAKQRPGEIVRPIPQHHVLLLETDPGDRSLADEHRRRGWPPYLVSEGVLHDYVVVGPENNPVEAMNQVNAKVRERARERIGLAKNKELPGRAEFEPAGLD
jgi:hypothetical protein